MDEPKVLIIEQEEDGVRVKGQISGEMALNLMVFMAEIVSEEFGLSILEVGAWLLKVTKEMSGEEDLKMFQAKLDRVIEQNEPVSTLLN